MKAILSVFLLGSTISLTYAAETKHTQLQTQKSTATTAHLTTRIPWVTFPQPRYNTQDLANRSRNAMVRIHADSAGIIQDVDIQESTGVKALDQALIKAVYNSRVQPHNINGKRMDLIGYQVFEFNFQENEMYTCTEDIQSQAWQSQQQNKKPSFRYHLQPEFNSQLNLPHNSLQPSKRHIDLNFKVDKKGQVKQVKLKKSSGIKVLDQHMMNVLKTQKVSVPRKYGIYKKSKLSDRISFNLVACTNDL